MAIGIKRGGSNGGTEPFLSFKTGLYYDSSSYVPAGFGVHLSTSFTGYGGTRHSKWKKVVWQSAYNDDNVVEITDNLNSVYCENHYGANNYGVRAKLDVY